MGRGLTRSGWKRACAVLTGTATMLGALVVTAGSASATASSAVSQPPAAVVGHSYSYQLEDAVYGTPTYASLAGGTGCQSPSAAQALPLGLSMSSTGLIHGVPVLPEQTQFCVLLIFGYAHSEQVVITLTVGTGDATLDAVLVPDGTQVAIDATTLNPTLVQIELLLGTLTQQPGCLEYFLQGLLGAPQLGPPPFGCIV